MPDYSKLAKGLTSLVKGAEDVAPAVNRLDMNFKDVTKRIPELTEAANMVARGEMTAGQYDSLVRKLKPVTPYDFVPQPATADDAMRALTENKRPMFGKTNEMSPGEQADLRLDIPAYKDHGVWVNSIHRKDQPTMYGSTSSVKNATMIGAPDKALKVAQGGPKAPFAVIRGEWNPMDEAKAVKNAQKYLNHPDWKQVGYDPERHGFFYDRASMAPVVGADEVIQIGPLVLAKKPKYGKPEDFPFKKGGGAHMKTKQGAVRMQVGGFSALAKLGTAGTKLTKAEMAALRARGMGVPGIDFADPMNPKDVMRMSEALGISGSEGKTLNLTQADRSRVFGPNKGGTGFSGLQLTSEPHQQANTTWGVGKPSHVTRMVNANTPDTVWSTFIGSPTQHMSNPVTVERMYEAHKKAGPSSELVEKMNAQLNSAIHPKTKKPIFPNGIDISDPSSLAQAQTFDQRKAIAQAMTIGGEKKGEKATQEAFKIIKEETDPLLTDAPTYAVGNRLFTIDKDTGIYRPDLNKSFPEQTTGTDFGLIYEPAPIEFAAPDFVKRFEGRKNKHGNPQAMGHKDLTATTPKQFISEEYLTNLQKEGYQDGGSVQPSFTQRLQSAMEQHMAAGGSIDNTTPDMTDGGQINYGGQYKHGGKVHIPVKSLRGLKPRNYAEAGYVDPLGAPDYEPSKGPNMAELAGRMIKEQASKEGAVLSTPEGRRDIALKVASHMPGLGMGGDLVSLVDWVQTLIPGLYDEKPTSVLESKKAPAAPYRDVRELQRVPKFPLRNVIGSPTGEEFQEKFKEAGLQGENEAPVTEFIGSMFTPGAVAKLPKAPRAIEGGLNAVTAAARRPFTPATITTEAVAPDLAKFKGRDFQDYATKQMIGEGAAVPMTTMGGRKTTQRPGQGVYINDAGQLELNPMVGIDVPRAGNLSKNKSLRADIATAGQELNQEAMAAHRFVPMATNNIKDATAMMVTGPGGRALSNEEVIALGKNIPGLIVSHSPRTGGVFLANDPYAKGDPMKKFLNAQSVVGDILGAKAKVQFGKADADKDLMYMMRHQYPEEGGRGTSQAAQAVRNSLKRMDQTIPTR
jgi:hypothetical protein